MQVNHTQLSDLELKINTILMQMNIDNNDLNTELHYHTQILNNIIEKIHYNNKQLYQIRNTIKELKRNTKEHLD